MRRRAFNLVEIIIVVALLAIVSIGLFVLIKLPMDVNVYSEKEYSIQSDLRHSSEMINEQVRNATAAFLITKKDNKFTKGWNYFICEEEDDYSRIVIYEWDDKTHVKKVLSEIPSDEVKFSLRLQKSEDTKLLKYVLAVDDKARNKKYDITTELKALNSVNVIDESSMDYSLSPPQKAANCLAYRKDRPDPDKENEGYHHVLVSFVLDTSGSMAYTLDGYTTSYVSKQRITKLREQLYTFFATMKAQDKEGIVDVRFYPFSFYMAFNDYYATGIDINYRPSSEPSGQNNNKYFQYGQKFGKFINIKKTDNLILKDMVDSLTPGGATNVGDGIRHAYHGIKTYEEEKRSNPATRNHRIKHFLFVLTDGVPTYCTSTKNPSAFDRPGLDTSDIYDPNKNRILSMHLFNTIYNWYDETPYFDANFVYGFKKDAYGNNIYDNHTDILYSGAGNKVDDGWLAGTHIIDDIGGIRKTTKGYEAEILYVDKLGKLVKDFTSYETGEAIDVTVVGFSSQYKDNEYCDRIGKNLGAPVEGGVHYKACTSDEAIKAIFKTFTESVASSTLWYVAGPQ